MLQFYVKKMSGGVAYRYIDNKDVVSKAKKKPPAVY